MILCLCLDSMNCKGYTTSTTSDNERPSEAPVVGEAISGGAVVVSTGDGLADWAAVAIALAALFVGAFGVWVAWKTYQQR